MWTVRHLNRRKLSAWIPHWQEMHFYFFCTYANKEKNGIVRNSGNSRETTPNIWNCAVSTVGDVQCHLLILYPNSKMAVVGNENSWQIGSKNFFLQHVGLPDEVHDEINQPDIKFLFDEFTKVNFGQSMANLLSALTQSPLKVPQTPMYTHSHSRKTRTPTFQSAVFLSTNSARAFATQTQLNFFGWSKSAWHTCVITEDIVGAAKDVLGKSKIQLKAPSLVTKWHDFNGVKKHRQDTHAPPGCFSGNRERQGDVLRAQIYVVAHLPRWIEEETDPEENTARNTRYSAGCLTIISVLVGSSKSHTFQTKLKNLFCFGLLDMIQRNHRKIRFELSGDDCIWAGHCKCFHSSLKFLCLASKMLAGNQFVFTVSPICLHKTRLVFPRHRLVLFILWSKISVVRFYWAFDPTLNLSHCNAGAASLLPSSQCQVRERERKVLFGGKAVMPLPNSDIGCPGDIYMFFVRAFVKRKFSSLTLHFQVKIDRPVFILGAPRTGTTFLQRLLARDKRFRSVHMQGQKGAQGSSGSVHTGRSVTKALQVPRSCLLSVWTLQSLTKKPAISGIFLEADLKRKS